ncbi:MAG: type VI secretion system baseplate subunit TssG [Planctomycetota bacterium]
MLLAETGRFEFFQAVRLLQHLHRESSQPVGTGSSPHREAVRFRSSLRLRFPSSDIRRIEPGRPDTLPVAFFGIAAPHSYGSLPLWYVQLARAGDGVLRDFFNIFNHRLTSLFYCAWERNRVPIAYERTGGSFFEQALFSVVGLGSATLRGRLPFDDLALLRRAGALVRRTSQELAGLVADYFGVRAEVLEFVPRWYELARTDRMQLGRGGGLGRASVLGERTRLAQSCFRVRIGPLDAEGLEGFLPGGPAFESLVELIRFGSPPELDFEIQLVAEGGAIRPLRLARDPDRSVRLGWSTWLGDASARERDDPVFAPTISGALGGNHQRTE